MFSAERRTVLIAGMVVAVLLGCLAAYRGQFDWIFGVTALAAVALAGLLGGHLRSQRAVAVEELASDRPAIAEALLATIPDPVILVDRRVVVIEANQAARALLPTLKLRHPLSFALRDPDVLDGIGRVLRTGQRTSTSYVTRGVTERAFEVQIGALPMPEHDRGRPNIVLFLRDVTSAHRLETMRVDFVANASHELRTPLSSLLGFIETLQGPARDDAKARERFLAIMATQARRMARLVDDLLSLSRIELHEHVAPTTPLDLGDLARQMVELQAAPAQERGITMSLSAPDRAYPVTGDRDELLRVIENLIENAIKYGGANVSVSLSRSPGSQGSAGRIELAVHDDGPGIAAEHLPRLTERFYRVDTAQSRKQGGTGLGLAIVKHSLNRHRGRLTIESSPGQGTTMRVSLPEGAGRTPSKSKPVRAGA